jgi:hypothetical protein
MAGRFRGRPTSPKPPKTSKQRARVAMARGMRKGFARAARASRSPIRGLGGERRVKSSKLRSSLAREMNK